MAVNNLSQEALAKRAEVSPATVCRALRGVPMRRGQARERLYKLAGIVDPRVKAADKVVAAFEKIWDSSDAHAKAVIGVINALGGFSRKR